MPKGDIAVIGMAVMGQNLMLNISDHGYVPVGFNRTVSKVDEFLSGPAKGRNILGAHSLPELVAQLKSPRRVMLLVKAGPTVDEFIARLLPLLDKGDIIIDGGNTNYEDSIRRSQYLREQGMLYVGCGVSGGEEGARFGPSLMPGGHQAAWPVIKELFQAVSAKAPDGAPCCDWVGDDGAGHYVKMVHNGIEYGDMQLICEVYHIMKDVLGMSPSEMHEVFAEWNKGELSSYLVEISTAILDRKDEDGAPLVDKILDAAGQKGTGKWTCISSLHLGIPVTLIAEAVYARCLSSIKEERMAVSELFSRPVPTFAGDRSEFIENLHDALLASKIVSYAQGFMLLREAARYYNWQLNMGSIASMWRGGCVIRSVFLGEITKAFTRNPALTNLIVDDYFHDVVERCQNGWRNVVLTALKFAVPAPAMQSAIAFFDAYRSAWLPANLLQAQRDWFGTHTYERIDQPRGQFFHTNWTGKGGNISSTAYQV